MKNMFINFPTENVRIIKPDANTIDDVEALIDCDTIFINDSTIDLSEGDIIERILPSGAKEQFLVIDRGFYRGMPGIPDHYQAKVEKQSAYTKVSRGQIINQYNISNTEKVNINSTDNSTNYNISAHDISVMEKLRSLATGLDNEAEIVSAVDEMQQSIGQRSFAEKYNAFIQCAANHMTLFAPFIPTLSALLTQLPIG